MHSHPAKRLVLFAKAPRLGLVKTRLARTLGDSKALEAYQVLADATLASIAGFQDVTVQFSPDDALQEIQSWLRPGWRTAPQGSGDLGERLARCFAQQLQPAPSRVVVIGSDCPDVSSMDVEAAWRLLETHDLVLGPALDGGYWLIGLNQTQPSLFSGIDWSTPRVLEQTLARADLRKLKTSTLRPLEDVDTPEDWKKFLHRRSSKD